MTTELNALASGDAIVSSVASSGVIDNTSTKWQLADLELVLAANNLTFTGVSSLIVHFVTSADGTTYPKMTTGNAATWKLPSANYWAANIQIYPSALSSESILEVVRDVRVPSAKFKVFVINNTGQALPASGNTLKLYPTPEQY